MAKATFVDLVTPESVIAFIGSHPDDETVIGSLLAFCSDQCRELWVVSLTKGEAGWNLDRADMSRTLVDIRREEFERALAILDAKPAIFDYVNGVSKAHPDGLAVLEPEDQAIERWNTKGDHGQTPDGVYARWTRERGDPAEKIAAFMREKKPQLVITMEPDNGFTGHPEHIATARATLRAVGKKTQLYYAYPAEVQISGGERISVRDLCAQEGKNYASTALASWSCYRSQFRVSAPTQTLEHQLKRVL